MSASGCVVRSAAALLAVLLTLMSGAVFADKTTAASDMPHLPVTISDWARTARPVSYTHLTLPTNREV